MHFEYWYEALIFIGIFLVLILVPCVAVGMMGYQMLHRVGNEPSKTPFIQLSIFWQLVVLEALSFLCLIIFANFFDPHHG